MKTNSFQLITAPGLPTWPRLYYDRFSRRAYLAARHPTWRSYQSAFRLATVIGWLVCMLFASSAWEYLSGLENAYRVMATLFLCCIFFPIAQPFIRKGAVGFLARQIFATKTVIWASPSAVGFKSRLYAKPVVIWRSWKDQKVTLAFILSQDDEAAGYATILTQKMAGLKRHLNEAMILEAVVSATDKTKRVASNEQLFRRTIPITEINSQNARKFTTVLAAAISITSIQPTAVKSEGVDIDG